MKCGWFNRYPTHRINNHGLGQTFCSTHMHHTLLMRAEMGFILYIFIYLFITTLMLAVVKKKQKKQWRTNTNEHTEWKFALLWFLLSLTCSILCVFAWVPSFHHAATNQLNTLTDFLIYFDIYIVVNAIQYNTNKHNMQNLSS